MSSLSACPAPLICDLERCGGGGGGGAFRVRAGLLGFLPSTASIIQGPGLQLRVGADVVVWVEVGPMASGPGRAGYGVEGYVCPCLSLLELEQHRAWAPAAPGRRRRHPGPPGAPSPAGSTLQHCLPTPRK